jgi:predicted GNAT family acetyltransferase
MPNFSRKDMPQVKTQDLGKALSMVADKVKVTKETIVASKLKKSQKELYKDKVQGIANRFTSPNKMKPLIISKDNHIVDGHHRWGAAIHKWGDDVKLNVHRIHLSAKNAIKLYKHIANTINEILENITIPIKVGDTVLGGKFKNKRIVVKSIDKNEKGDITINGKPLLKYRLVNEGKLDSELESKYGVSVDVFEYPTHLELKRIVVPDDKRGMGIGTDVMNDLIKYAVKNNKDIFTTPSSDFGGTKSRLVKFYKSFGFKNNKGSKRDFRSRESMVRLNSVLDEGNDQLEMMKLLSKAMKAMPGSPKQKKIKQALNKLRIKNGLEPIPESVLDEACWKGYKQVGGKKKGGKMVPNCVPINESTFENTIKSLIDITKVPIKMGIFDDSVLSKIKQTVISGVEDSLRGEVKKLNQNQKKEFNKYANELINPLKKAKTMPEFLRAVHSIGAAKPNILSRVESFEFIQESKVLDWLKNAKNKTSDWWNKNKNEIAIIMAEFLAQLIVEILFAVLNALLKSNSLKAPKIKFGGGKFGGGGASGKWEGVVNEIPMADLQKIDTFADKKLNPMDVVITDKHFFDRLNDPRNGKEISSAELIGFFKRLSKKKSEFVEFLNQYNSIVATDDRTNINIPFMKKANKAIAKTVMRKKDFKTPDKRLDI